jgi:hypothetical protein
MGTPVVAGEAKRPGKGLVTVVVVGVGRVVAVVLLVKVAVRRRRRLLPHRMASRDANGPCSTS